MALYAEPSTLLRPPSAPNIAFTSPQEPESPQKPPPASCKETSSIKMDIQLPPRLDLGSSQLNNNSVASTIGGHIAAIERDAKQKRDMVVTFFSTSIYAETDSAAPVPAYPCGNPSVDILASITKTVTYADCARSNVGLNSFIDPRKSQNNMVSVSSAAGQTPSSNARAPSARPTKSANTALSSNADRRILAKCNPQTLLNRPEPFILRQSLAKQIDGLTLASIPSITPTATGWAINPSDIATRDILLTQENAEVTKRTLSAYSLEIPVTWFNYAVTNVPTGFHNLIGGMTLTDASLVSEEALAQTHQHPGFCNPSRCTATRAAPTAASDWTSTLAPPDPTVRTPHSARIATDPLMPTCSLPCVPKRVNGKYIKPTRKELDAIRKHGELAFKIVNTPRPPPRPRPLA
ncbi:hypothetical protein DID88_006687 [Monilinia fructigena]|uniref:Uncharacterized protein n=1 Tax=Monilinia fructigena TaxID=38457 RepID=A0A395ICU1_9HELO|nr:hypothetical protein DID88_006687 [Monilinia fructigena]